MTKLVLFVALVSYVVGVFVGIEYAGRRRRSRARGSALGIARFRERQQAAERRRDGFRIIDGGQAS